MPEPLDRRLDARSPLGLEDLRWLRRLAVRLVQDPHVAEDVVQDTVVAALTHAPSQPREPGAARAWLARVLRNVVRQGHRAARRRAAREREHGTVEATAATTEVVEELAWHRTLVEQVEALAEPYRSTIVLRFLRERSPRDIAAEQGVAVKTVYTRIDRGLAQLREALDRRHGGDRRSWVAAVATFASSGESEVGLGELLLGGGLMGTKSKVVVVALVCALGGGIAWRAVSPDPGPRGSGDRSRTETSALGQRVATHAEAAEVGDLAVQTNGSRPGEQRAPVAAARPTEASFLRVVLEGASEEFARQATVTLEPDDESAAPRARASWECTGTISEFDLGPFLAREAGQRDAWRVTIAHPLRFAETVRVPRSSGERAESGRTVYEARVRFADVVYWPEFSLSVRDASTRAHLEDVELRAVTSAFMASQLPQDADFILSLGDALSSPIPLRGGRKSTQTDAEVAGLALGPSEGGSSRPLELPMHSETERGVLFFVRAPGYAWESFLLDVSTGTDQEVLLSRAATLELRTTNVQLARYAELGKEARIHVTRPEPHEGAGRVWEGALLDSHATDGVRLEGLEPGDYLVTVELGSWSERRPVLVRERLALEAREERSVLLSLADPPEPPVLTTLRGVLSLQDPAEHWGVAQVELRLYAADHRYGDADFTLGLADMERVGGALPTWAFRLEDVPSGVYQAQLVPYLMNWKVEVPREGAADLELVVPKLAEAVIETVDARTGERIPLDTLRYFDRQELPDRVHFSWSSLDRFFVHAEEEPGLFRLWMPPGAATLTTWSIPEELGYGGRSLEWTLVPGPQVVRFELSPPYAIHLTYRDGGAPLPYDDPVHYWPDVREVDGEEALDVRFHPPARLIELEAPGVYELHFDHVDAARFLPLAPRRVEVRAGETAEVVVDLRRR